MLSTTVWEGMLGKESFAVLNAAISGQMGWRRVARAVTALRAHLAYDCSLALVSLSLKKYLRENNRRMIFLLRKNHSPIVNCQ